MKLYASLETCMYQYLNGGELCYTEISGYCFLVNLCKCSFTISVGHQFLLSAAAACICDVSPCKVTEYVH